jgi:flagellar motor switch protein FliN/FliY
MPSVESILRLEVPIIVQIDERKMTLEEVMGLVPGTIIELTRGACDDLDILVNNQRIGAGQAVKVGENFGINVTAVGDVRTRVEALAGERVDEATSTIRPDPVLSRSA